MERRDRTWKQATAEAPAGGHQRESLQIQGPPKTQISPPTPNKKNKIKQKKFCASQWQQIINLLQLVKVQCVVYCSVSSPIFPLLTHFLYFASASPCCHPRWLTLDIVPSYRPRPNHAAWLCLLSSSACAGLKRSRAVAAVTAGAGTIDSKGADGGGAAAAAPAAAAAAASGVLSMCQLPTSRPQITCTGQDPRDLLEIRLDWKDSRGSILGKWQWNSRLSPYI